MSTSTLEVFVATYDTEGGAADAAKDSSRRSGTVRST